MVTSHLVGDTGNDAAMIFQMGAEAPIWKALFDLTVEDEQVLSGQASGRFEIDG